MTIDQGLMCAIVLLLLGLFVWGRWRYDVVALAGLALCSLLGLVPAQKLFEGFGHPAAFTVALVLVLSFALTKSGAASMLASALSRFQDRPALHNTFLLCLAAFISMFMNNVGALALLMPVAIQASISARRSPSSMLMPLSFASILGGLVTLIGTPPNIIISGFRQEAIGKPFAMFDFTPVGGLIAICGVFFLCVWGKRFVRINQNQDTEGDPFQIESYLFQVCLQEKSSFIGQSIKDILPFLTKANLELISHIESDKRYAVSTIPQDKILGKGDLLLIEGTQHDIKQLIHQYKLSLIPADSTRAEILHSATTDVVEVVIGPGSRLHQRLVESIGLRSYYKVNLLGLHREDAIHRGSLGKFRLRIGDVLLLHGEKDALDHALFRLGCLPLRKRALNFVNRKQALTAMGLFGTGILAASCGLTPLYTTLILIIIALVVTNILPIPDLYQGVEWPTFILLGAMIPIGKAIETTGLSKVFSWWILSNSVYFPDWFLISILLITTMTLSDVLNNAATAILMAPIAISIAQGMGASIDPFLMAIAIGASSSFLTPIGHQNNALIMGPGGYKFRDYWPLGLPLEIIILVVSVPLIHIIWPLYP